MPSTALMLTFSLVWTFDVVREPSLSTLIVPELKVSSVPRAREPALTFTFPETVTSVSWEIESDELFRVTLLRSKVPSVAFRVKLLFVDAFDNVREPVFERLIEPDVKVSLPVAPFRLTSPPDIFNVEFARVVLTASLIESVPLMFRVWLSKFKVPVSAVNEEFAPWVAPDRVKVPPFRVVSVFQVSPVFNSTLPEV